MTDHIVQWPPVDVQGRPVADHKAVGRPVLVLVGPGRHFGSEIVCKFLSKGYSVGVLSFRQSTIDVIRRAIPNDHGHVRYMTADISDRDEFVFALTEMARTLGRVDCLIYNPKVSIRKGGLETTIADLERSMTVNVTGALVAIQALLPSLKLSRRPCVILTGGGYKDAPDADKFALSVGKAGLHGLVLALKDPLRLRGIDLKTVIINGSVRRSAPGFRSANQLSEFYWNVYSERDGSIHRFPQDVGQHKLDQPNLLD